MAEVAAIGNDGGGIKGDMKGDCIPSNKEEIPAAALVVLLLLAAVVVSFMVRNRDEKSKPSVVVEVAVVGNGEDDVVVEGAGAPKARWTCIIERKTLGFIMVRIRLVAACGLFLNICASIGFCVSII